MDDLRSLQEIRRYNDGIYEWKSDLVAREASFVIHINGERVVSLACLPENLVELAYGFLFSEGLVHNKIEIKSHEYKADWSAINFNLQIPEGRLQSFFATGEKSSGCGSALSAGIKGSRENFGAVNFKAAAILPLMKQFQNDSLLFRQTGGVHGACLVRDNLIRYRADDIGRHNAVDKVAGMALLAEQALPEYILLSSGRISSEIVKKSVRLGIPMIVSHSAATSEAIRLGWQYKVYLLGFARGSRFNIYSGFEQSIFAD